MVIRFVNSHHTTQQFNLLVVGNSSHSEIGQHSFCSCIQYNLLPRQHIRILVIVGYRQNCFHAAKFLIYGNIFYIHAATGNVITCTWKYTHPDPQ